jgi:hypothetical protein
MSNSKSLSCDRKREVKKQKIPDFVYTECIGMCVTKMRHILHPHTLIWLVY